mgnify:FL=1
MTVMKEVKVGEVSGAALDYLVLTCGELDADSNITTKQFISMQNQGYFLYSTDWEQGGPIIEHIRLVSSHSFLIESDGTDVYILSWPSKHTFFKGRGSTLLIAAMRCYVASKLGEVVKVPQELL